MTADDHGEIVPVRLPPRHDAPAWLADPAAARLPVAPPGPSGSDREWSRALAAPAPGTPWHTPMPPVRVDLVEPPASVRAASWLWVLSAVCHVASWLLAAFVDVPLLAIDMADPDADVGGDSVAAAITFLIFGVLWSLVYAVPATVFGVLLRRGRAWVRVVLLIGGALMLAVLGIEVLAGWGWRSGHEGVSDEVWLEFRAVAGLSGLAAAAIVAACVLTLTAGARRFVAESAARARG